MCIVLPVYKITLNLCQLCLRARLITFDYHIFAYTEKNYSLISIISTRDISRYANEGWEELRYLHITTLLGIFLKTNCLTLISISYLIGLGLACSHKLQYYLS